MNSLFAAVANGTYPYRFVLLGIAIAVAGLAAGVVWQASHLSSQAVLITIGLSGFVLVWSWGLFLVSAWFGPNQRWQPPSKVVAAGFLLVWFIGGSVGFIAFTVSVLRGAGA